MEELAYLFFFPGEGDAGVDLFEDGEGGFGVGELGCAEEGSDLLEDEVGDVGVEFFLGRKVACEVSEVVEVEVAVENFVDL